MLPKLNLGFILLSFILINLKIILLNEESLILLCFVTFCFLIVSKLGQVISSNFETETKKVKSDLLNSNLTTVDLFKRKKTELEITKDWNNEFSKLKIHFNKFNMFILQNFTTFYFLKIQKTFEKKLIFSKNLEQQLLKLISLIILEKMKKIVILQTFCLNKLKLKNFEAMQKIYFREHLKKII